VRYLLFKNACEGTKTFSNIQLSDVTDYNKNLKNPFCVVKAVAF